MIVEKGKRHYDLIKDFNTFMYDNKLHRGRITCHIKDCFKINGKQRIKMPKKGLKALKEILKVF